MSDAEKEEETQETPARFDKKAKMYALLTFGAVCLMFVLVMVFEKLSHTSPLPVKEVKSEVEQQAPTPVMEKTFEQIAKEREKVSDPTTREHTIVEQAKTALQTSLQEDPLEREKRTQQALEYKRSALAARSQWGILPAAVPAPEPLRQGPTQSVPVLPDEQLSGDEQREMIKRRLQEVAILKQQIQAGNYSAFEGEQKRQALESLEQSFSAPPPNIAGFTQQNQYNASTDGLFKLPIGTLIPGVVMSKVSSDNVGTFKSLVSQDIFDANNEYVLIPKGAEIIAKSLQMSGPNGVINPRMGYTVPWIVLPNGNKIDLSKSTGLDREGMTGISDQVERHLMAQFLGVAAYALVANASSYEGTGTSLDDSYVGDLSQGIRDQTSPLAQQYLAIKPTNTIRPGQSMNVIVEDEIYLKPWRHIYEDYL